MGKRPVWLNWPNLVTVVRILFIPVFVYLAVSTLHRALAAWLLGFLGATDYLDGYLARRLNQVSELGKILDPVCDRLLMISAVLVVAGVGAVPWWFAGVTLAREILVSVATLALAAMGAARIDVLWWGKTSTFALMTAYPLFLLTSQKYGHAATWQGDMRVGVWVVGITGLVVAWAVLGGYLAPAREALRAGRAGRRVG
jgi:cardiolipin synthase